MLAGVILLLPLLFLACGDDEAIGEVTSTPGLVIRTVTPSPTPEPTPTPVETPPGSFHHGGVVRCGTVIIADGKGKRKRDMP